ncbi:hypothetical protein [Loigolactobacillus coryniformis]|nr:hypothetical protein [Loigolactobacillus coryniformis]
MSKVTLNRLFSGRYQVNTRLVKTQKQSAAQENAYAKTNGQ